MDLLRQGTTLQSNKPKSLAASHLTLLIVSTQLFLAQPPAITSFPQPLLQANYLVPTLMNKIYMETEKQVQTVLYCSYVER